MCEPVDSVYIIKGPGGTTVEVLWQDTHKDRTGYEVSINASEYHRDSFSPVASARVDQTKREVGFVWYAVYDHWDIRGCVRAICLDCTWSVGVVSTIVP